MKKDTSKKTRKSLALEIINFAKKMAYTAVKTIYTRNPTDEMRNLLYGVQAYDSAVNNPLSKTLSDGADIVNIAAEIITQAFKLERRLYSKGFKPVKALTFTEFVDTCFYEKNYHTYTYNAINNYIYSQKSTKGRKVITAKREIPINECRIYKNGVLVDVTAPAVAYEVQRAYQMELISLNALQGNTPANYERLSVQHDIELDNEYEEAEAAIIGLLSDEEKCVFKLLQRDYNNARICDILGLKKQTVSTYKSRIREKVANSGLYDEYSIVRQYKTK